MRPRKKMLLVTVMIAATLGFAADPYHPAIDPANFQAKVDNPYFPLIPGTTLKYLEKEGDETSENEVTVTHETKTIMGVRCVVVHDIVKEKGEIKEDTYDWYAQDKQGTVWYFGEATREYHGGGAIETKGSWEAGVNGQPGVIMPGNPKPGKPYRQEYSAKNAEDMGQILSVDESVTVPAGTFTGCVKTKDWSLLESGSEHKWYAKGIGVVQAKSSKGESAVLVSVTPPQAR